MISRSERVDIYKHVAQVLKESNEVAGEGFILRLAEITVDATLEKLEPSVPDRADIDDWTDIDEAGYGFPR